VRLQLFKANELKRARVRRFQVHWQRNASSASFQRVTQRAPPIASFRPGKLERGVQSAIGADGLFDERDDVILPADIGLHEQGASTGRSDLPGSLLSLGNAAAGDDHIRAFFGKREGSSFADAGGASGDEDSLVFEGFYIGLNVAKIDFLAKVASPHETENRTFSSRF